MSQPTLGATEAPLASCQRLQLKCPCHSVQQMLGIMIVSGDVLPPVSGANDWLRPNVPPALGKNLTADRLCCLLSAGEVRAPANF